ncbi:MAG: cadherin-like domain-containing protein, partial [Methylococcales bacterium]|nr:cadherin-like domain-containing protein [Methylococcales bacterium]
DAVTTEKNTPITIDVLANDTLVEGVSGITISTDPTNGVAIVNSDNSISYTSNTDYTGNDSLVYRLTDVNGKTASATVTIQVTGAPESPVAQDDTVSSIGADAGRIAEPGWAGNTTPNPEYTSLTLDNDHPELFIEQPWISFPSCSLYFEAKPGATGVVTVPYRVKKVVPPWQGPINGQSFKIYIGVPASASASCLGESTSAPNKPGADPTNADVNDTVYSTIQLEPSNYGDETYNINFTLEDKSKVSLGFSGTENRDHPHNYQTYRGYSDWKLLDQDMSTVNQGKWKASETYFFPENLIDQNHPWTEGQDCTDWVGCQVSVTRSTEEIILEPGEYEVTFEMFAGHRYNDGIMDFLGVFSMPIR